MVQLDSNRQNYFGIFYNIVIRQSELFLDFTFESHIISLGGQSCTETKILSCSDESCIGIGR